MTHRPPALVRAELVGVERLRATLRLLFETTPDERVGRAAWAEHVLADIRCAHLEAELRRAEQAA